MDFTPIWNTIEPFYSEKPLHMYHREQDPDIGDPVLYPKNLHILARTEVILSEEGEALSQNTAARKNGGKHYDIKITADDRYRLFVNGRYVAEGPAPAYPEHAYYQIHELTEFLQPGENEILVHLYYQGLVNRSYTSGDGRFGLGVWLNDRELDWQWARWDAFSGETIGYDTEFVDSFDGTKAPGSWQPMLQIPWKELEKKGWGYCFSEQPTKKILEERIAPVSIRSQSIGSYEIDLGREISGYLDLEVFAERTGEEKQVVRIFLGEELDENGEVRYKLRCNCTYQINWIVPEGISSLVHWDYKAFRYARVELPEGVTLRKVQGVFRHYPMDRSRTSFRMTSGMRPMEQIFELCRNTIACGTQEHYVDCPSREKGQYLGDTIITSRSQVWLTGSVEMLRKSIDQFTQTLEFCPGMAAVAPGFLMQEIADFSLLFPELVLNDYYFTEDRDYLKKNLETIRSILTYFENYRREDGLLTNVSEKWNLVDWPEAYRDAYDHPLTRPVVGEGCHAVINSLYVGAWKRAAQIERMLGMDACAAEQKTEILTRALIRTFTCEATGLFTDSEGSSHSSLHANLYPLYFELVSGFQAERMEEFLKQKGICCGPFPAYFYLRVMARCQSKQELWLLIEKRWETMLTEGATTCFEAWGREEKWNTSLCHPWSASALLLLIEELAGARPGEAETLRLEKELSGIGSFVLEVPGMFQKTVKERKQK